MNAGGLLNTSYGAANSALTGYGSQAQGLLSSAINQASGTAQGSNSLYQPAAAGTQSSGLLSNALGLNGAAGHRQALPALALAILLSAAPAIADEGLRPINPQPSVPSPPGALAPEPFATKITQRVDLTDFDPRGCDGAHDSGPGIQAAVNYLATLPAVNGVSSGILNLPPGSCIVNEGITGTNPIVVQGVGTGIGPGAATSGGGTYIITGSFFGSGAIVLMVTMGWRRSDEPAADRCDRARTSAA